MSDFLVTVYIANYNYSRYLKLAVESVLNQTLSDFELIIIDDGSTDDSKRLIGEYRDHPKVRAIFQENRGLNVCGNVALKASKGKYLVRLDADDYWDSKALETMVAMLEKRKDVALVFPDYFIVDSHRNIIKRVERHDFEKDVTLYDQPAHGACTMIRKSVLQEVGGYDEEFNRQDGYDIWLKVINDYKVKNINIPLFSYRQHGDNITRDTHELLRTRARIKEKRISNLGFETPDILTIIPVRGDSVDPSSQPLRVICDKPLIEWTIEAAIESRSISDIVITTPDLDLIKYLESNYSGEISIKKRPIDFARVNIGIEKTLEDILEDWEDSSNSLPDLILILYIEYPFRSSWQIDETVHTQRLFNVDVVDGVMIDDRFFYKHDGTGLRPMVQGGGLHLERDQLYRRVGGIHLMKTKSFLKKRKVITGTIGHINFDQRTGFQIRSELDWVIAETLAGL